MDTVSGNRLKRFTRKSVLTISDLSVSGSSEECLIRLAARNDRKTVLMCSPIVIRITALPVQLSLDQNIQLKHSQERGAAQFKCDA